MKRLWLLFFILLCPFSAASAGEILRGFSRRQLTKRQSISSSGLAVEMQGPDAFNPSFRKVYQWTALTKAFADNGYNVIAELRPKGTRHLPMRNAFQTKCGNLYQQGSHQKILFLSDTPREVKLS